MSHRDVRPRCPRAALEMLGKTAAEFDPKGKAADEMLALYTYLHTRLQGDINGKVQSTRSRA